MARARSSIPGPIRGTITTWRGRPWNEAVIYELHMGSFTDSGTFDAARDASTISQRSVSPPSSSCRCADFPGRRNWGYDGVLPFAPDASYGHPRELKALVDRAHALGLMVLIDVVYNHFGPEGNYLSLYAPQFFSTRHHTPWGAGINFDGRDNRAVREFVVHNALYWLTEFHFDGLRLDAVHSILDDSPVHILAEIAQRVRAALPDRHVHLLLENEHNQAHWLERGRERTPGLFNAQWNDDVHHVLHVATTADAEGYYADYIGRTDRLGRALAEGFAFQGEPMSYRGAARGQPSAHLPPTAFVSFLQNHDQIGNRALGERITALAAAPAVRAATALYLLLPQIPMLFMGEEWHSRQPFLFFCDFGAELGEAVTRGRRQEFARFAAFRDQSARDASPIRRPKRPSRAASSTGRCRTSPTARRPRSWYRELLAVRRRHIVPLLPSLTRSGEFQVLGEAAVLVRWQSVDGTLLTLVANLKSEAGRRTASRRGQPAVAGGARRCRRHFWFLDRALERSYLNPPTMIPRATYRLQLHKGFGFDAMIAVRPLPGRARRQPCLLLALSQGTSGQPARLRHRRSQRAQSRARR